MTTRNVRDTLGSLRQDALFGVRQLLVARSFTIAAIVTLAIGIGATTAVFSVVEAVVLRPFPFPHADRVVDPHPVRDGAPLVTSSNLEFATWRALPHIFDAVVATVQVTLTQLNRVGPVIDGALARGANGVQDIAFDASNTDVPRRVVLAQAVADARADATAIAKPMGGSLGRLVSITTQDEPGYPRAFLARARAGFGASAETPITPGEITVEASVIGRWQFVAP
jgi:hypothetical protein